MWLNYFWTTLYKNLQLSLFVVAIERKEMENSVFRDKNDNVETTLASVTASCLDSIQHTELTPAIITPAKALSGNIELARAIPPASVSSGHGTVEQQQIIGR